MARAETIMLLQKLAYYKDIAATQRRHAKYLDAIDDRLLPKGLRRSEIFGEIRSLRAELRETGSTARQRYIRRTRECVDAGLREVGQDSTPRLSITVGGKPHGERNKSGAYYWKKITVGYMWLHNVYERLYVDTYDFGPYLILSAQPVRVTIKSVDLYEVTAFQKTIGDTVSGYVAVSKTEPKFSAFAKTASLAVKRVEDMVSDALDAIFTKETDT